jgi:hypothetical protein
MHDRHDDDLARPFYEQDTERKRLGETSADIKLDRWVQMGIKDNAIDGILHRREESSAEVRLLPFVMGGRLVHFEFSIGMDFTMFMPAMRRPW